MIPFLFGAIGLVWSVALGAEMIVPGSAWVVIMVGCCDVMTEVAGS